MGLQEGVDMMSRYGAATKEGGNGTEEGLQWGCLCLCPLPSNYLCRAKHGLGVPW